MSRLTPNDRDKLTKLMGELNERVSNDPNLSSTLSSSNSSNVSSLSSCSSIANVNDSYVISSSAFIIDNDGSDTSSDVDRDGDTNVIGDSNNKKYDDNSTLFDAVRNSESAQITYSSTVFPLQGVTWEFPSYVEITHKPSKAERMAHAIFYSIWSDDITWLWIALFLLTYRF
jgi:hypothetical protein